MMNQYKIESYIADGETMSVSRVVYADTPEEAYRQYVTSVGEKNEDGTEQIIAGGMTTSKKDKRKVVEYKLYKGTSV